MVRKIILILTLLLVLTSCSVVKTFVPELFYPDPDPDRDRYSRTGTASKTYNFKKEDVLKNVLNRPINKKIVFGNITLLIPEGTRLNNKKNRYRINLMDEEKRLGLPIYFLENDGKNTICRRNLYCKKINGRGYSIAYTDISEVFEKDIFNYTLELQKKIAEANGFKKGEND